MFFPAPIEKLRGKEIARIGGAEQGIRIVEAG
jgi:hypothetical protein